MAKLLGEVFLEYLSDPNNKAQVVKKLKNYGHNMKHMRRAQRKTKKNITANLDKHMDAIRFSLAHPTILDLDEPYYVFIEKYKDDLHGDNFYQDRTKRDRYELSLMEAGKVYSTWYMEFQKVYNIPVAEDFELTVDKFTDLYWDLTFDGYTIAQQTLRFSGIL